MKVGEYVRTIHGIAKVTDIICGQDVKFDNLNIFDGDEDLLRHHNYDGISVNDYYFWNSYVIGNPTNDIMDLIEVGDYVNGSRVEEIEEYNGEKYLYLEEMEYSNANQDYINVYCKQEDIKSILTKEQFSQMEYRIGE